MFGIGRSIRKKIRRIRQTPWENKLDSLLDYPRFTSGYINVFGKPFKFNDSHSFIVTYREIFQVELYKFSPSYNKKIILDCGANMGLSVLYFAKNYPSHKIIAFEPDPKIFEILKENVQAFQLSNVEIHQKAVWDKEETISFFTDNGMGGRVNTAFLEQKPTLIGTVVLKDYLTDNVDFLKIDIEGAEDTVLRDAQHKLSLVNNIFFEYHNDIHKPQRLHELLKLVSDNGFIYYIKESGIRNKPFIDSELTCEIFDMTLNVFCYKKSLQ